MRTEFDIILSQPPHPNEVKVLLNSIICSQELLEIGAKLVSPTKRMGQFPSLDSTTVKLVIDILNMGAIGLVVKSVFDLIIQWQKNRTEKISIKCKDFEIVVPKNASESDISRIVRRVSDLAKVFQESVEREQREGRAK